MFGHLCSCFSSCCKPNHQHILRKENSSPLQSPPTHPPPLPSSSFRRKSTSDINIAISSSVPHILKKSNTTTLSSSFALHQTPPSKIPLHNRLSFETLIRYASLPSLYPSPHHSSSTTSSFRPSSYTTSIIN